MTTKLDRAVTGLLTIAVLGMAAIAVRREFFPPREKGAPPAPPTYQPDWRAIAGAGAVEGSLKAPVVIVEFADLQCPGCRAYQRILKSMKDKFGERLAVAFVHFPISYHKYAVPGARGAECARRVGKFHRFVDAVFSKQESLGVKAFWGFAIDAGVEDSSGFASCLVDTATVDKAILSNLAIANTIDIEIAPTILVNGWRFKAPPSEYYLEQFIRRELDGKGPVRP